MARPVRHCLLSREGQGEKSQGTWRNPQDAEHLIRCYIYGRTCLMHKINDFFHGSELVMIFVCQSNLSRVFHWIPLFSFTD